MPRIISINILNFNLDFGDEGKPHRCFKLIDIKDLNISLDLIQIHILEVKRFIEIIEKYYHSGKLTKPKSIIF